MNARWCTLLLVACGSHEPTHVTIQALPPHASSAPSNVVTIPNTDVEDTPDNRAALDVCERYRRAMEARDADAVLAITSRRYHDGDITYEKLGAFIKRVTEGVISVRYDMHYENISRTVDKVMVDFHSSAAVELQTGKWIHKVDTSRLVLVREDGAYKIIRGM